MDIQSWKSPKGFFTMLFTAHFSMGVNFFQVEIFLKKFNFPWNDAVNHLWIGAEYTVTEINFSLNASR